MYASILSIENPLLDMSSQLINAHLFDAIGFNISPDFTRKLGKFIL